MTKWCHQATWGDMALSHQQIQAAELISRGYSHQETADAINVSRRTILRWMKQQDFRDLSFGLTHRAPQSTSQQAPERTPVRPNLPEGLKIEDLIPDALSAVQEVLRNPDSRNCDRLKACSLVGAWANLGGEEKMAEMQALQVLIQAGWIKDEAINTLVANWEVLSSEMKDVLRGK